MSFFIALGVALILTPASWRLGVMVGLLDRPSGDVKIHSEPVSVLGGSAVVVSAFVAAMVIGRSPSSLVLIAVSVGLVVGLVDDVRPIRPSIRALLIVSAGTLAAFAWSATDLWPASAVLAILMVFACANAVNLLDGQDGLAAGLAALAALGLAWVLALAGRTDTALLGLALGGALLGFLPWNHPPARVYLGNGGAYAVGTLLAVLATDLIVADGWRGLLAAGTCLSVFAFELLFTFGRRVRSGRPIVGGDRLHSYDILATRLRGRAVVNGRFLTVGAAAAVLGAVLWAAPLQAAVLVVAVGLAFGGWVTVRLWPAVRGSA
jgi:UDP-GlcNAc:undecaprenyl-phosphate GlcNAc-1-phosphate transferase